MTAEIIRVMSLSLNFWFLQFMKLLHLYSTISWLKWLMQILRLEPRLKMNPFADTEVSDGLAEESIATSKTERKMVDLTSLYGTKKDRDKVMAFTFVLIT